MSRSIPTINTARLTLRAMRPQDFDRYAQIWADPETVRHIDGGARSRDAAWDAFLRNAGHWQVTGFGQWAVEDHKSKRMIGQAGFFFGARGLGADFDAWPEAGWIIAPEAQGQGLGSEAARAAHDWFDRVVTGPLVCQIAEQNDPSLKMASRLGYKPLRTLSAARLLVRKSPP